MRFKPSPLAALVKPLRRNGDWKTSVFAITVFSFAFIALLNADSSISLFKFIPALEEMVIGKSKALLLKLCILLDAEDTTADNVTRFEMDDRFEFDPKECSVNNGRWIFNESFTPLYTDKTCPYLDNWEVACVKNGRKDSDYLRWEWQPDDCTLPRFNPELALKKLQGKRMMFVGDSLQRGQWQSFVCMVEWIILEDMKSMEKGSSHHVFKAKEYNATIEFYWAPFLIESNFDLIGDPNKRILKVDSIEKHAKNWRDVDILVFDSYIWWMGHPKHKTLWGSFVNGEEGHLELDTHVAYEIGLKTWANWIDSNVDSNKTRVFFTTMSPAHLRSEDWNKPNGIKCYNETRPVTNKKHWGSGSDKRMMSVVAKTTENMRVPVTFINITQLSEYRIDAHSSVYREFDGRLLTDEEKADPSHPVDCIHWCLPGVPDTWNQIFLAYL